VEINPLASTDAGLLALDGKVTLDDKADFRQGELLKELLEEQQAITGGLIRLQLLGARIPSLMFP